MRDSFIGPLERSLLIALAPVIVFLLFTSPASPLKKYLDNRNNKPTATEALEGDSMESDGMEVESTA